MTKKKKNDEKERERNYEKRGRTYLRLIPFKVFIHTV